MLIALILLGIATFLIVGGVFLAIIGIVAASDLDTFTVGPAGPNQLSKGFGGTIGALMKKAFAVIFDSNKKTSDKLTGLGVLMMLLGLGFLISAAVAGILTAVLNSTPKDDDKQDKDPAQTPSTSVTPSPTGGSPTSSAS